MLERQRPHFWHYFLLAIILALLGWFLLVPILLTVRGGFAADPATGQGFTLDHLFLVFRDPLNRTGLMTSGLIACCTTILCILIALPLAVLNAGYAFPGKKLLNAAALVPLILPPFVGAIGLRAILGRQGAINTLLGTDWDVLGQGRFWGVVIAEALHLYPIIFLNATAALANLDPALDEAAENLGAGFWKRFFKITLPLIRPGLFAGATIVFIWSFTELGTPLMFDMKQVTPVQIFEGLKEVESSAEALRPRRRHADVRRRRCISWVACSLGARATRCRRGRAVRRARRCSQVARASSRPPHSPSSRSSPSAHTSASSSPASPSPASGMAPSSPRTPPLDHYEQALTAGDSFGAIVTASSSHSSRWSSTSASASSSRT
jgi:ABC-type spermidine/putrescine transport system permease subunit II